MKWHPMVKADQTGATSDSNQRDMEFIRGLPEGPERRVAIDKIITANVPLVFTKANTYINLHNDVEFLCDDLISEGLVALTLAVFDLASMETPDDGGNCTAFIATRIVWAMCKFVEKDEHQQIPKGYSPPGPIIIDPRDEIETQDLLKSTCNTPEDHVIIDMRKKGCNDQEIADCLGLSRRAVNFTRNEIMNRYYDAKQKLIDD